MFVVSFGRPTLIKHPPSHEQKKKYVGVCEAVRSIQTALIHMLKRSIHVLKNGVMIYATADEHLQAFREAIEDPKITSMWTGDDL